MKLGFGLYRHMLTEDYFRFARQCGATHLIVHLANYYGGGDGRIVTATDEHTNYGECAPLDPIWEEENLRALVKQAASFGLTVEGIENFSPADWYDVLLDGPRRAEQMEKLKTIVRAAGAAGMAYAMGYMRAALAHPDE